MLSRTHSQLLLQDFLCYSLFTKHVGLCRLAVDFASQHPSIPSVPGSLCPKFKIDAVPAGAGLSLCLIVVYFDHAHTFQRSSLGFPTPHARRRRCARCTPKLCQAGEQKNRNTVQSSFDTLAAHPRPQRWTPPASAATEKPRRQPGCCTEAALPVTCQGSVTDSHRVAQRLQLGWEIHQSPR